MYSAAFVNKRLYSAFWKCIDYFYPPHCAGCGAFAYRFCPECRKQIVYFSQKNVCQVCGSPVSQGQCQTCLHIKFSIKSIKSLGVYNQSLRKAIHSLKFNRNLALGDEFSAELAELVLSTTWPVDLIVPVPASRKRRSERGYNQAEIIAFPLALLLKLPFSTKSLVKVGETRSQIGLSLAERINNIQNAFSADPKYVNKKNVLLVDDVSTTGATLNACAQALISAGAQSVYGVTIAKAILNTEHSDDLTQISF